MAHMFMLFPEGRYKALTLSYDDGVHQDERLIDIMNKNGLKGTFNLSSGRYSPVGKTWEAGHVHRPFEEAQATAIYGDCGQEIACHAYTHLFLNQLPRERVAYEVIKDREALETQFGRLVRGMAYPYGTWNEDVVDVLGSCGIVYCRTTRTTEKFDIPTRWLTLDPTCHHKNPRLTELATKFVETEKTGQNPYLFYLWGHSYEFESDNNWDVIEGFAEYIGGKKDIWYATNIEIYDYVKAYNSLIRSVDGTVIHNPTAIPVWFRLDREVRCIAPGETLSL